MDEIARYNKERWEALANANVQFSRPFTNLTPEEALKTVDPMGVFASLGWQPACKDVLCLASGGGQQSAAFSMLGSRVTVFDLSEAQLARDQQAADHYGFNIRTIQGDMRNLEALEASSFDLVWHAFSINFIPDAQPVFDEVCRVLRPGGLYRIEWTNPLQFCMSETDWTGEGYLLRLPYRQGTESPYQVWDIEHEDGRVEKIQGPREFNHTLSTVINGLVKRGFVLLGLWEALMPNEKAEPGSWDHFLSFTPPWLTIWAVWRPDFMQALSGAVGS